MSEELKSILEEWEFYRKLTLDLLEIIPEEKLGFTVGKNMGAIGKQFRHIGDVQLCYVGAIKTRKIDFNKYRRDYSIENSKTKLKGFLEEMDKELLDLLGKLNPEEIDTLSIDWGFEKLSIIEHIRSLIQHEILHHGELIVYVRTLGIKFPDSWKTWGL